MTEIELKAHVTDPVATGKKIALFARFISQTVKNDTYWQKVTAPDEKQVKVRIRDENGILYVTYKQKELKGQIEVNDEQEFTISDRKPFEILLEDLGFAPYITKNKKTHSFSYCPEKGTDMTSELSEVGELGWFVEIEILAESPDPAATEHAGELLRETLARCGIGAEAIEDRHYTDLLRNQLDSGKRQMYPPVNNRDGDE
jgi:adenylate cyclase class 2